MTAAKPDRLSLIWIMDDRGLLSALAGRLSMIGLSVMTFDTMPTAEVLASIAPRSVLVVEDRNLNCPDLQSHDADRWALVMVVGSDTDGGTDDRIVRVAQQDALAEIPDALVRWCDPGA